MPNFESEEEFLNQLQEDLADKGYDIEYGENFGDAVEILDDVDDLPEDMEGENIRVPLNLELVNRDFQAGPTEEDGTTGYDELFEIVRSSLYYREQGGDIPYMDV